MAGKPWTDSEVRQLERCVQDGMSRVDIAGVIGRSREAITKKGYTLGLRFSDKEDEPSAETPAGEGVSFDDNGFRASLVTVDRRIKTAEDACEYGQVDMRVWEIDRFSVNKWEQGQKADSGANVIELWQVKVWLKRKVLPLEQKSFEFLQSVISSAKWKPPARPDKRADDGDHLLEVSLFDAHFGKLCWAQETGTDYDTDIASRFYLNAVDDLLADNSDLKIERILFPVGQDFFNADNLAQTTTGGTPQDVDDRYHRVFAKGFEATVAAIERCRKVAPVQVVFVEGNHDTHSGWHLTYSLKQTYRDTDDVEVDIGPKSRKYVRYGVTLLGLTHGDKTKATDMPTLMARECSEYWHECQFYEWHTGHFHKEKKLQQAGDETNGVVVRVLPSLSGTDRWHYQKGFTLNRKAAMSFAYHKKNGMRRTSYAYAR